MKHSIIIILSVVLLLGLGWLVIPRSLFHAQLQTPTVVITPKTPVPTEVPATRDLPAQPTTVSNPVQVVINETLGYCFSYPQGYTQIPSNDTVEIAGPNLPGSNVTGLFWLEISDSYDRTAEKIADQDMTSASGLNIGRWNVTLGGEQAVVLDGMPGQELQRRVYTVHDQTLYVLAFWPTHSDNKPAGYQMETLYTEVTNSWVWISPGTPCPATK